MLEWVLEGKGERSLLVIGSSLASKIVERTCQSACLWGQVATLKGLSEGKPNFLTSQTVWGPPGTWGSWVERALFNSVLPQGAPDNLAGATGPAGSDLQQPVSLRSANSHLSERGPSRDCPLPFYRFPRTPTPSQPVCCLFEALPSLHTSCPLVEWWGPRATQEGELGEAGVLTSWVPGCDVVW